MSGISPLRGSQALALFGLGAGGGLVGDAAHVQAGTTTYLGDAFPFVWESAVWFPLAVGLATVLAGDLRLRLGPVTDVWPSRGARLREGAAAVAAVLAIYAASALVVDQPEGPGTTLVVMLAVLCTARFASGGPALVCAAAAAVLGPVAEVLIVEAGASRYGVNADGLLGVALWLPALYFAFGAVVSRLAELLADDARGGPGS